MNRIVIFLFTVLINISCTSSKKDNLENNDKSVMVNYTNNIYQLFPTQNMWTFIKLNTRNGQMWQVQYDTRDNNRFETYLNSVSLVTVENETNNRFILYSTQNMWTFILLDQIDGRMWQVQWSIKEDNKGIFPIK